MADINEIVETRGGVYGHPYDNFYNIAELWKTYLNARFPSTTDQLSIDREDVAHMMILLKIARSINQAEDNDTIDDIAGYAKCIHLIREKENEN